MKIIIIGGVAGGMSAATRLRRLMEDAEIVIFEKTRNQIFSFGVSFLENVNLENEVQTWLAVDYAINLKERVNKCQN